MTSVVESLFTAVLLILAVLLVQHLIEGTATTWLFSKFQVKS